MVVVVVGVVVVVPVDWVSVFVVVVRKRLDDDDGVAGAGRGLDDGAVGCRGSRGRCAGEVAGFDAGHGACLQSSEASLLHGHAAFGPGDSSCEHLIAGWRVGIGKRDFPATDLASLNPQLSG